jgi:hypothetical protein
MLLHHVLDLWVDWWRRHQARGEVIIVLTRQLFL